MAAADPLLNLTSTTHSQPDLWLPRLTRLLLDQIDLASQLETIGQQQAHALASDEYDQYLACLADREPLIAQLLRLNEEIKPFMQQFSTLSVSLRSSQLTELQGLIAKVDAQIATITQRDQAQMQVLKLRREETARQMTGVHLHRQAVGAYGQNNRPQGERLLQFEQES